MTRDEIKFAILSANISGNYSNEVVQKVIEKMKHTVGMNGYRNKVYTRHGKKFFKPYRNDFNPGGEDILIFEALVELGYAWKREYYHLTRKGMDWLGERLGCYIHDEED